MTAAPATVLTDRFTRAVDYARIAHAAQVRKGTTIPYLTHLLGVAALVIEHGGSEDQAIAGLLHDLIEDCGEAHEPIIRAQFDKWFGKAAQSVMSSVTCRPSRRPWSIPMDEASRATATAPASRSAAKARCSVITSGDVSPVSCRVPT